MRRCTAASTLDASLLRFCRADGILSPFDPRRGARQRCASPQQPLPFSGSSGFVPKVSSSKVSMRGRTLQLRGILNLSRQPNIHSLDRRLLQKCSGHQFRSFSLESLTTPFNRKELRAAAAGTLDLSSEYHLVYIGTLARRIATYKIGAFLLSACGLAVAPVVVATAQVPLMALPGNQLSIPPKPPDTPQSLIL